MGLYDRTHFGPIGPGSQGPLAHCLCLCPRAQLGGDPPTSRGPFASILSLAPKPIWPIGLGPKLPPVQLVAAH